MFILKLSKKLWLISINGLIFCYKYSRKLPTTSSQKRQYVKYVHDYTLSTLEESLNLTKPKPREWPVYGSFFTIASVTAPYFVKYDRSSSTTEQHRAADKLTGLGRHNQKHQH